ncbi:hypothetical protein XENTR_v10001832 [Xenopus tropicalis]|uniref:BRCA1-A complex subunit Abraxas 1 n=2 Tax=Xenopus tropicalis TaxID=8364 RepID=ABRX1_XENTR|nr:BRCA1-A complex subunit Abraxas 1 [Xenopus tropicalis]XP_012819559.1 BRCA1-A complex subunit Abraxas 1 isoform X1 [Xenopus tropicalis]XP_012819566.1 BRCA1-A complex subunit Abraxas 1 isoform X1 [Xenopus tropicalis]XP_012819571.1 BRCA1-A complex subunit Abraxas 1 isoform X1 [Xenopus tropicalis]Q28HX0.1 RecName: Full=BRCA1-A complex subunit Abraxas 1; AltName: Full=Coiled-coil domain-containing protein 98; AltName: Full=Protein FAM175A [Xenopus tropicalis]AAI60397.1 family with sequence simil|eukprot:XP_012819559.1 PREDICTED: BRCA1-A complex subunit Abraxas isoform X1 [Xenopus tropicalis]
MEGESTTAVMSGFVFGALTFHHLNSGSDTEGFLLGDVVGEAKNSITDSQMDDVEVLYTIDIQKHVPCYKLSRFYNVLGDLNIPELKKLLADQKKSQNVIGWYKFRHNTEQIMTFRERLLHKNLQEHLSNSGLVFLLLTSNPATETKSTHRLEYALHKPQDGFFHKVPLVISNLGMSDQQGYKTLCGSCVSVGLNTTIKKHRLEFFNEDGALAEVNRISNMYTTLQDELKKTCSQLVESEHSVEQLLEAINELKKQIAEKKKLNEETGNKVSEAPEENVLLCEALRKFFPQSTLLQSCRLSLGGRQIPHSCTASHNISDVNELTLMVKQYDIPEAHTRQAGKRKACSKQLGRTLTKKSRLLQLQKQHSQNGDSEGSDSERPLCNSGTETDGDILESLHMDVSRSKSPIF